MDWLTETIPEIKGSNWAYKFLCFCLGKRKKKLSYQDYYLFLYALNKRKLGVDKARKCSMIRILQIYKELHDNNLPEGVLNDGDDK